MKTWQKVIVYVLETWFLQLILFSLCFAICQVASWPLNLMGLLGLVFIDLIVTIGHVVARLDILFRD